MPRIQLAINVSDLEAAVAFYSKLFAAEPTKRRPGYANFALASPALKLVLFEQPAARGTGTIGALNHLGVEVDDAAGVSEATERLASAGLPLRAEHGTTCCHAVQDKVWVRDPDGAPWEIYTVLADAPVESTLAGDAACCATTEADDERHVSSVPATACC